MRNPFDLFGLDIREYKEPQIPKLELSEACPCSEDCRREFNRWLVEQFGYEEPKIFKPGLAYVFGNTVVMCPEDVVRLQACA